ncbi:MAG: hypothetical protein QG657_5595, partial [Acidobacteriota bacterium]|nr:hypothetical protein [Acidobacteriota bacterium]
MENQENNQPPIFFNNAHNQENFEIFYSLLSQGGNGFCLCQALPPEQKKILAYFKTSPMSNRIHMLDMAAPLSGPMELQHSILDAVDTFGSSRDIFFIYNFEECIALLKTDAQDFFQKLNPIRDFFSRFQVLFVFFMTEYLVKEMIRNAFDFYDWMKFIFDFQQETQELPFLSTGMAMESKRIYSDIDEKIKYLEGSLSRLTDEKARSLQLMELGELYVQGAQYDEALSHYKDAVEICSRIGDKEGISSGIFKMASIYGTKGNYAEAISLFEQSLKINELLGNRPGVALSLNKIGEVHFRKGDYNAALGYYEQALAIDEKVYGPEHPTVAIRLNNLGSAYDALGEKEKAIGYYEQALAIVRKAYGEQHPHVAGFLNNLGLAYANLGEKEKAIGYYEQALAIDEKVYGQEHPKIAIRLNNLGLAYDGLGEKEKAIGYFEQALAIVRKAYGEQHPHVAGSLN